MTPASRNPRQEPLRTLLVGDIHRSEFAEARADLAGLGPLVVAANAAEAAQSIEVNRFLPQVIVLAEAYPGQIALAEVERLRTLAPLARMIGLLGSWCEGETRTGRPWPGVVRVYWYEWSSCRRELQRLCREGSPLLSLPSTATDEERLLARSGSSQPHGSGLIVVSSPHRATVDWLSDVCRQRGYEVVAWLPGPRGNCCTRTCAPATRAPASQPHPAPPPATTRPPAA